MRRRDLLQGGAIVLASAALPGAADAALKLKARANILGGQLGIYPVDGGGSNALHGDSFDAWLGRPATKWTVYLNGSDWTSYVASVDVAWTFAGGKGRDVIWTMAYPGDLLAHPASYYLAQAASGAYDANWTLLAQGIAGHVTSGLIPIRFGHEMNGDWYPWSAYGNEANYKTAFRRFVAAFRTVSSRFTFNWCVNHVTFPPGDDGTHPIDPTTMYPGDDVVDEVGMDLYLTAGDNPDDASAWYWKLYGQAAYGGYGLDWAKHFATAHGKAFTLPEWAIGRDAPVYLAYFIDWILANVAWHIYFETIDGIGINWRVSLNQFPNSSVVFKAKLGVGVATVSRDFVAAFGAGDASLISDTPSGARYYPRDLQPTTSYADGVKRLTSDGLVVESRKANRIGDPAFAGAAVGVLGSGGGLPTGSERNSSFVFTVVSIATDANGNKEFRFTISRTGASPSGTNADWRPISSGLRFAAAAIGAGFHGFAKVNSVSGVVSRFDALLNEQNSVPSTVYNYTDSIPLDGSWKRFSVNGSPRTVGNTFQPIFRTTLSDATADFSIDITVKQIKCEDAASLVDISSWDAGSTATETPQVLNVPAGPYDVLQLGQDASCWNLGQSVSPSGYALQLPVGRSLQAVKKAIFYPSGLLNFGQRAARVDTLSPVTWTQVPRMTQVGGTELLTLGGKQWVVTSADQPWSIQQAANRAHVQRFAVQSGDHWAQDITDDFGVTQRERTELQEVSRHAYGADVWISYSFLIEPGKPTALSNFCRIGQFHDDTISGEAAHSNAMGTNILPGDIFQIDAYYNPNPTNNTGQVQVVNYADRYPIERGVWHGLVFRIRPSTSGTGLLQVWKDGILIVNFSGAWGYNAPAGWFWKYGIYRFLEGFPFAVQFANFELSSSDLSARVSAPRDVA